MRAQRSRLGSIDSYRGCGPRSRSPSPRGHRSYHHHHHHRSPPSRRSSHRSYRSPSPRHFSRRYSPSYSPRERSRSPCRRSESSVEKFLRAVVENGQDGIGTNSPANSLSNVNRDDLADGQVFSRALSHPRNLDRGFFREENPSRPFSMRHDEDSYNRDIFIAQLDRSINSEFLQHQSRENKRGGEQESKYFQYDRKDRLFDESIKSRALLAETEKYCKQSLNRSPSLIYMDEDFCKLERIRRKREEDLRSSNISTDNPILDSANQEQSSESRHHSRSEKTSAVPFKSILKKRSDDSSIQVSGNFSKGKKPPESASESVNQYRDFLQPHERASQDGSGFSCILGTTTDSTYVPEKILDPFPDNIEDEEKFLYGDDDGDSNNCLYSQKIMMSEKKEPVSEKVNSLPPAKPENLEQSVKPENLEQSVKPENLEQSVKPENLEQSVKPENLEQSRVEYEKIRDLLKTIGLDIGMAEIDKLAARTEERLHGKKTAFSHHHSVVNHKAKLWERQKHSLSSSDSFPSPEAVSPVLKSDYNNIAISGQNKPTDMCKQSGVPAFLIPSAPPSFLPPPGPISGFCHNVPYVSSFTPTQFFPNSAALPALPVYDVYQHNMGYTTSDWSAQQVGSVCPNKPEVAMLRNKCTNPNLRIIKTITISNSKQLQDASTTAPSCQQPQLSKSSKKKARRRIKVIDERRKLELEKESQHKKLFYLKIELDRLSKLQVEMLQKKRKEEDPLLVELSRVKENTANKVAELETNMKALKEKQGELDKVIHSLKMNHFKKDQKLSSEDNPQKNPQSEERTFNSI
ncbi:zinc finger protein 318-like isoform X2 [Notechis scutatus]|uniref:Zinc finger protein 318-like isoform X2 n=1 Tax=Notechis scutatus TaxID=8663 RepID=A0A6J1V073_9SAUR|nr:zinc finger protein 318-like isoform X2 [Notechis scutatus]